MKKQIKKVIVIGLIFLITMGNCVIAGASDSENRNDVSLVFVNGNVEETLSTGQVVVEKYEDIIEFNRASHRINEENVTYAPDSYNQKEGPFLANCVLMRINEDASFAIDAEHIVTIIQYTNNHFFYIQYDSEGAAGKAVNVLQGEEAVEYAVQNANIIFDLEDTSQSQDSFPFEDVCETDWFYPAVKALYKDQIMIGDNAFFHPYEYIARAQFVLILYRMENEPKVKTVKSFHDISGEEWYGNAVLWAAENGIVTGYENGFYGPADKITREQMAVMLYRYAKYKNYDLTGAADFSKLKDADTMQLFAKEGMNWAVANEIIRGKDLDGNLEVETLEPQGSTSRAEGAVMIQRFIEKYQ